MTKLRRRHVVRTVAALGVGGLAGCNGSSGDQNANQNGGGDGGDGGSESTANESATPEATPRELNLAFHEKLTATDPDRQDNFGRATDIQGGYAIVGAPNEDQPNGEQSGAAYVFRRDGATWRHEAKLVASDGDGADQFGTAVALTDGVAIVGAIADEDPHGDEGGSAYVFERADGSWSEQAKLVSDDGRLLDSFGAAVTLSDDGTTAVVGAPGHRGNNGNDAGAVYLFARTADGWTQETKLAPILLDRADFFGQTVAIDGDTLLVAAPGDEDPNGSKAGTVYPFRRTASGWDRGGRIAPDDETAKQRFGSSLAIADNRIAVGAPGHSENGSHSGAAYVFERANSTWTQRAKLLPDDGGESDRFGFAIGVQDEAVLVSAPRDDEPNGLKGGSAYLFELAEDGWTQRDKFSARHGRPEDNFGWSVSVESGMALCGVPREGLDAGHSAGAAHLYRLY